MIGIQRSILLLLSLIFAISGVDILLSPIPDSYYKLNPAIHAHLALLTPNQIGAMFVIVGCFGILAAFTHRFALAGYWLLQAVSTFWMLLYLLSWIETGYWRALFAAAQYILFIGVLFLASGVVEVPKKLARRIHHLAD